MVQSLQTGPEDPAVVSLPRRLIVAILVLGLLGTGTELALTSHTEDLAQWIPLVLILLAFLVLGWLAIGGSRAGLRVFQWLMVLFIGSGAAGIWLHYQAKAEFQIEMDPSLGGLALFWKAVRTISPPALAPGIMIQLGLLGLLYAWRNPLLNTADNNKATPTGE